MKYQLSTASKTVGVYIFYTITIAMIVGVFVFNPLWRNYSPPFPINRVFPAITAPVDGPFYLENATDGYQWETKDPLSLWFHPLLSTLLSFLPGWLPINYWFWIISILFGIGSIILTWQLAKIFFEEIKAKYIPLLLLAPGALGLATGNPEMPTLFFNLGLLLSVIKWKKIWLTISFAIFAILTKPNALYMVPILGIYFLFGTLNNSRDVRNLSLIGIVTILIGWFSWMLFVDFNTKEFGSYVDTRLLVGTYVAGNPIKFFIELVNSLVYTGDLRNVVRYSTAIIIPIANLWIIGRTPISNNVHRYALASGNIAMLIIALMFGNPNKIIVYATTLPGYFSIYCILFQSIFEKLKKQVWIDTFFVFPLLIIYCLVFGFVFIFGTPLGWYY